MPYSGRATSSEWMHLLLQMGTGESLKAYQAQTDGPTLQLCARHKHEALFPPKPPSFCPAKTDGHKAPHRTAPHSTAERTAPFCTEKNQLCFLSKPSVCWVRRTTYYSSRDKRKSQLGMSGSCHLFWTPQVCSIDNRRAIFFLQNLPIQLEEATSSGVWPLVFRTCGSAWCFTRTFGVWGGGGGGGNKNGLGSKGKLGL